MNELLVKIEGVDQLQAELQSIKTTLDAVLHEKKTKTKKLVIEFTEDEYVPEYVAARFLGIKQNELEKIVNEGLLAAPNKWNRYKVSDLVSYRNYINEEA